MNVMIVGQKWLGAEVFRLVSNLGHTITCVAAPSKKDRLYELAMSSGTKAIIHDKSLNDFHVPNDTDLIICAHAWCYITKSARGKSLHGAIGFHPSLLPRHRGRDAIRWAIHMKESITGGTVYWINDKADTGAIAAQDWCHIRPADDPVELWKRELGPMALDLFEKVLSDLSKGNRVAIKQDDELATFEPAWSNTKLFDTI